jgi:hypothetical protein
MMMGIIIDIFYIFLNIIIFTGVVYIVYDASLLPC